MSAPTATLSLRKHKTRLSTQEAQKLDDATPSYVNSHPHDAGRRMQDAGCRMQDAHRTPTGRTQDAGRRTHLYKQTLSEVVACVRPAAAFRPAAATGFRPRRHLSKVGHQQVCGLLVLLRFSITIFIHFLYHKTPAVLCCEHFVRSKRFCFPVGYQRNRLVIVQYKHLKTFKPPSFRHGEIGKF